MRLGDKDFFSVADLAELLGVTKRTVHRWIKEGQIKYMRLGKKLIRFNRSHIEDFLNTWQEGVGDPGDDVDGTD